MMHLNHHRNGTAARQAEPGERPPASGSACRAEMAAILDRLGLVVLGQYPNGDVALWSPSTQRLRRFKVGGLRLTDLILMVGEKALDVIGPKAATVGEVRKAIARAAYGRPRTTTS
jgi:hypothetical protein